MTVQLTESERSVLLELLEAAHRERLHELHRTDALAYKGLLREQIAKLEQLTEKLIPAGQPV